MKVSEYVVQFLLERGVEDLFLVSGGGIMHLLDAVGQSRMRYYCNYHEQACAISAEGYARIRRTPGACLVTVGPGAVNALAGVVSAWVDSIPLIVLSGQVRSDLICDPRHLRQKGPQEGNVIAMATPVTKYAKTIMDPTTVRAELERAWEAATTGRPGPVWLEFPLDVQAAIIDEHALAPWIPAAAPPESDVLKQEVAKVVTMLAAAKRPIIVPGNGIHLAGAEKLLQALLDRTKLPSVVSYASKDLVAEDQPGYVGVFGTAGQRRANFAIQSSDCLLGLAAGFCVSKVGFGFKGFAPKAKKIVVDIDRGQLEHQVLKPDLAVCADVRAFLEELLLQLEAKPIVASDRWLGACAKWRERYPVITPDFLTDKEHVNSYVLMDRLADALVASDIVIGGNGLDAVSLYQAFKVKRGQRCYVSGNWGSMGWDLPLAVGGCIAANRARTIVTTGDGSIQWNVQELLTISHNKLPIKIFVLNNRGYSSIRATQINLSGGRMVASDETSGVANPDFEKLAAAYGLHYGRIKNHDELVQGITRALGTDGPSLCEVNIATHQFISPKAAAFRRPDGTLESPPLEDMTPRLPPEEIWENMHQFDDESPS